MAQEHPALVALYNVYRALSAARELAPADQDDPPGCFGALAGLLAEKLEDAYDDLSQASQHCTCGAMHPEFLRPHAPESPGDHP